MSKKDALFRYHHIISKIRTKASTLLEPVVLKKKMLELYNAAIKNMSG